MTQTAVAAAAGLDRSFYVEVEHARHSISVDRAHAIADALGVDIRDLFPGAPSDAGHRKS
jgi:transcriptional regulator with XRE-family HTH domain